MSDDIMRSHIGETKRNCRRAAIAAHSENSTDIQIVRQNDPSFAACLLYDLQIRSGREVFVEQMYGIVTSIAKRVNHAAAYPHIREKLHALYSNGTTRSSVK